MNLNRIVEALLPYNPRPRGIPADLPFVWDVATLYNGTNFTLETALGNIDLLSELKGVGTYDDAANDCITIEVDGYGVKVLSIDGLIRAKTAAGRDKDIGGLKELHALKQALSDED
jgi:predicted nucleotidyltransferase